MALPKYKTSRANTHSRRANWKAKAAQTVTCPNCGAPALPHMALPSTGGRVLYISGCALGHMHSHAPDHLTSHPPSIAST